MQQRWRLCIRQVPSRHTYAPIHTGVCQGRYSQDTCGRNSMHGRQQCTRRTRRTCWSDHKVCKGDTCGSISSPDPDPNFNHNPNPSPDRIPNQHLSCTRFTQANAHVTISLAEDAIAYQSNEVLAAAHDRESECQAVIFRKQLCTGTLDCFVEGGVWDVNEPSR